MDIQTTRRIETYDVTYDFTAKDFTKTSRLPLHLPEDDGSIFIWFRPLNHERITNEAYALELISRKTTIPVPRLLDYGVHKDGRRFLVTERVKGVCLTSYEGCSKRGDLQHTDGTTCETCFHKAHENALKFLEDIVFPQLRKMTARERGLNDFVMFPRWLSPSIMAPWKDKKIWQKIPLQEEGYVFQHGDLGPHNIMIDEDTLEVTALLDWEYAGYFPPGWERYEPWTAILNPQEESAAVIEANQDAEEREIGKAIGTFYPDEYLECYEEWHDKEELRILVGDGRLPDPDLLRVTPRI